MKSFSWAVIASVFIAAPVSAQEKSPFPSDADKLSYTIGVDIGTSLKRQSIEVNPEWLAKGLGDAQKGTPILTEDQIREVLLGLQQTLRAKEEARVKETADKNKKEGEAFLAQNKKKKGIVTLPSGLQYKIITAGKGKKPQKSDTVTTNYKGTLINGTEFDSSYDRGEPTTFPVSGVIPGWTEALQLMPIGSKWQLFVPPALAYGERGAGGVIGPNATLIFDVELLGIEAAAEGGAKTP